jgi:hypothetical protein
MVSPTEFKHPTPSDSPCELCDRQCPEACKKQQQAYGCHACVRIGCWARSRACLFERHNHLVIRLSRYRSADPYVTHASAKDERAWIGADRPSLEPFEKHVFGVHVPGYDMRRKIQAKDPLCCSNAFFVQIRTVLATIAGIRMCQDCPHCAESDFPCQDAFGSSAELVGGFAGRADALFGAVEAQKTNGSLHFHFKLFVQRLHQDQHHHHHHHYQHRLLANATPEMPERIADAMPEVPELIADAMP